MEDDRQKHVLLYLYLGLNTVLAIYDWKGKRQSQTKEIRIRQTEFFVSFFKYLPLGNLKYMR